MRLLLFTVAAFLTPSTATARDFTLISGNTRAGVSAWGVDCGPRPTDSATRAGARYAAVGDALVPQGNAPALFGPGICRAATGMRQLLEGRTGGGFDCQSRADSPKRVSGRVDRQQDGAFLTIRHRFEYAWALDGSQCRVLMHGTWRLQATAPRTPSLAVASAPTTAAPIARRCARPGPVARVRIKGAPARSSPPGARHRMSAEVTDAAGCRLGSRVVWQASAGRVDPHGAFVAPLAGTADVQARVGGHVATVRFDVTQPDDILAAAPPSLDAPATPRPASLSAARVIGEVAPEAADPLPWLRIGFVLLVLIAGVTVYRVRRR